MMDWLLIIIGSSDNQEQQEIKFKQVMKVTTLC